MKKTLFVFQLFAALISMCASVTVFAAVQIVSVAPATTRAPLGQSYSVNLTWRVSTSAPPATLFSTYGEFRLGNANGAVIGTVNKSLSRSAPTSAAVVFNESLLIPRSVIYSAFKMISASPWPVPARIVYVRAFDDGVLLDTGVMVHAVIDITGQAAAGFNINRLALQFEDDAIEKIARQQQLLRAKARITYTGSGVLRGVWEVADPSSTSGTPFYRPLRQVSEVLSAGGEKILLSPRLPMARTGLHLVRLRLIDPTLSESEPSLRYFVQSNPAVSRPITLLAPDHLALLGDETKFVWQPVKGASAYRLELFEHGAPVELPHDTATLDEPRAIDIRPGAAIPPSTGMLVPGDQTSVPLTLLTRNHLQPGRTYYWCVKAIGSGGTYIGESPLRAIRIQ